MRVEADRAAVSSGIEIQPTAAGAGYRK